MFFDRRAGLQASLPLAVALGRVCCRDQPTYVRWAAPWRIHAAMPSMDGTYDPHAAGGPQVEASCADACAAARAVAASGLMFRTCDHDRACPGSLAEPLTVAQCPRTSSASAAAHAHGRDGTGQFRPTEPEPNGFWVRLNMLSRLARRRVCLTHGRAFVIGMAAHALGALRWRGGPFLAPSSQ